MDKRKFNGGSRKGAGRPKGTKLGNAISKEVEKMLTLLLEDEVIKNEAVKQQIQLSIDSGWIYIIEDTDRLLYKVGISKKDNLNQRLSLYKSNRTNINLLYCEFIESLSETEEFIHEEYNTKYVKGDWGKFSIEDIMSIIRIINMNKYSSFDSYR